MNAERRDKQQQLPLSKDISKHHNQALGDFNPTQNLPHFKHLFDHIADKNHN